ncbi:MAG: DUF2207 domain-containing protein, partial [Acidobacteriales bacterium]|nr:DUF2207 domain-containing protein [Terriglobales bacterium]
MTMRLAARKIAIAVVCWMALSALGFARSWEIADFGDNIQVQQDGSALVRERITLNFEGDWHGIHRTIPIQYPGPRGTNYTLFVKIVRITEGEGNALKYESSTSGDFLDLKIPIPGASDATRVVEIEYTVRNAVRFFNDHDEFYWNVTGNDWPVPIHHVSAIVSFPANTAGSLRAQAFTGVYGSSAHDATSEVNGAEVAFATTSSLPMRGGLTVDVFIPQGLLSQPGALTRFGWFLSSNPVVFLPFVTLGVMYLLWRWKGRDPDPGVSVAPQYEPPKDISPAEAGTLLDDTTHPRDITSTIVD